MFPKWVSCPLGRHKTILWCAGKKYLSFYFLEVSRLFTIKLLLVLFLFLKRNETSVKLNIWIRSCVLTWSVEQALYPRQPEGRVRISQRRVLEKPSFVG